MKMSAKQSEHRDFLNSLRSQLNVDDQTIANLELRMTGKCQIAARKNLSHIDPNRFCAGTFRRPTVSDYSFRSIFPFLGVWAGPGVTRSAEFVSPRRSPPVETDFGQTH